MKTLEEIEATMARHLHDLDVAVKLLNVGLEELEACAAESGTTEGSKEQ